MEKSGHSSETNNSAANAAAASSGNGSGILILDQATDPISDAEFERLYRSHGAIVFRNAARSDEEFAAFTDRFGHRWMPYQLPGREQVIEEKLVQTVATGAHGLVAHSELCHSPVQPEMACLFCDRPPTKGGETTLFDGAAIAEQMSASLRDFFDGRQFRYIGHMTIPEALHFYYVPDLAALQEKIAALGWDKHLQVTRDFVLQDYAVPALPVHEPSGKTVFVNQLVLNACYTPAFLRFTRFMNSSSRMMRLNALIEPIVRRVPRRFQSTEPGYGVGHFPVMDDGSIVPLKIMRELNKLVLANEIAVKWHAGDILVFDNNRFMHGRRHLQDTQRRILTRFGFPRPLN